MSGREWENQLMVQWTLSTVGWCWLWEMLAASTLCSKWNLSSALCAEHPTEEHLFQWVGKAVWATVLETLDKGTHVKLYSKWEAQFSSAVYFLSGGNFSLKMWLLLPNISQAKCQWLPNLSSTYTLSIDVGETQTPPAVTDSLKWSRPWKVPEREPLQWTGVDGPYL